MASCDFPFVPKRTLRPQNHASAEDRPAAIAALLAPLAEVYYRLSHQKPIFTRYSVETLRSNSLISSRKATEELGYQPRPVAATIEDTVAWWKQNRERTSSVLRGKA